MNKSQLYKVAKMVEATRFNDYRSFLLAVYEKLKQHFPDLNYESFSDHIGMGHCNAACLVINGKRPLTPKAAAKVAKNLGLTGEARRYFLKMAELGEAKTNDSFDDSLKGLLELKSQALPTRLDAKQLSFYENWHNAAILELLQVPGSQSDPQWLAQHLIGQVAPSKIQRSLELMSELGLIRADDDDEEGQRLIPTNKTLSTGSEVIGLAVFAFHQQMIDLAKKSLKDVAAPERDISSLTIAGDAETQARLKEEIRNFRKRILTISEQCQDPDRVMQVNFQMFPVTKPIKQQKRRKEAGIQDGKTGSESKEAGKAARKQEQAS